MTDINIAERAFEGKLKVEDVNAAAKEKLKEKYLGNSLLYWACSCGIEVVEAILDKKVNIDGLSGEVSVDVNYY
jgi:hypothetical protein